MAKKIVVLDFDNTICDTAQLKEALASSLETLGVRKLKKNFYFDTYETAVNNGRGGYSPSHHAALISTAAGREKGDLLEQRINDKFSITIASKIGSMVAPDFKPFCQQVQEMAEVRMLSFGDKDFQWSKIKAAGVLEIIDIAKVTVTESPLGKEQALLAILEEERGKVVFINDDHAENELIANSEFVPEYVLGKQALILEMRRGWKKDESPHDSNQDVIHDLGPETTARLIEFLAG